MNRGPLPGSSHAAVDFVATAVTSWGNPPDWIAVLAEEANRSTLRATARRIGYSDAVVSEVIRNKYKGMLSRVEGAVRGALMGLTVTCPVLGTIGRETCLAHQRTRLSTASPMSVKLYHACRGGCRHASTTGGAA